MTFGRNDALTFYDLSTSPDIVRKIVQKRAWDDTKDKSPLFSFLELLPDAGGRQSKRLMFGIGNYFGTSFSLAANFTSNTSASIQFNTGADHLYQGDIVNLYHTTDDEYCQIRIDERLAANQYSFTVIDTDNGATTYVAANTLCKFASSSVNLHGDARPFLNKKGELGTNWVQRMRDTIGKSDYSSEDTVIEDSTEHLVRMAHEYFAEKMSIMYYTNRVSLGSRDTSDEYLMGGGLPYFYNPHDATYALSSGKQTMANANFSGVNKVVNGSEFSLRNLIDWMCDLTFYGGKEKFFLCSDFMLKMMIDLVRSTIGIQRTDLSSINLNLPYSWDVQTASLIFGNAHFLRDTSLNSIPMLIKDDTDNTIISDPLKYIVAVDPKHIKRVPYINRQGKVCVPGMSEVARINNSSIDKMEFDATVGLEIDEPRSGGYFGISG